MSSYQETFIEQAIDVDALKFGDFTLKSGRQSPYFFNMGAFTTGQAIATLGACYADAILDAGIEFDQLFGPAYKGIPIVVATAMALHQKTGQSVPYSFNRKEAKTHGEGGNIVGVKPQGKVLILDDVITAGTAITETFALLSTYDVTFAGVMIALDRQEKGQTDKSAAAEMAEKLETSVYNIIKLDDIVAWLDATNQSEKQKAVDAYRQQYAV